MGKLVLLGGGINSKHPKDRFFFVSSVTSGVDANGGKFTSFTPAFDG